MGKTRRSGATRPIRDAITGEPIARDTHYVMIVHSERVEPSRYPDEPADRTAVPTSIDSAEPYPGGHLGGRKWTPAFARYIRRAVPTAVAEADRELHEWWATAYGRERVQRGFIARYGTERGHEAMAAALAVLADLEDYHRVAERLRHTVSWVARQRDLSYEFAYRPAQSQSA